MNALRFADFGAPILPHFFFVAIFRTSYLFVLGTTCWDDSWPWRVFRPYLFWCSSLHDVLPFSNLLSRLFPSGITTNPNSFPFDLPGVAMYSNFRHVSPPVSTYFLLYNQRARPPMTNSGMIGIFGDDFLRFLDGFGIPSCLDASLDQSCSNILLSNLSHARLPTVFSSLLLRSSIVRSLCQFAPGFPLDFLRLITYPLTTETTHQ